MHARIDGGNVALLTRTGLDWTHRYQRTAEALQSLRVKSAYLDGELCALNADGVPVFSRLQAAMDEGRTDDRHAGGLADRAGVACAGATEARSGEAAISRSLEVGGQRTSRAVAVRAVDMQLQAVPADVGYRLDWKCAEHARELVRALP